MLTKNIAMKFKPSVLFKTSVTMDDGVFNVSGGAHYLASVLRMNGVPFYFYDESYVLNTGSTDYERLERRNVKVIAIPIYSKNFIDIVGAIKTLRIMMPDVWIVCGGPAVNTGDFENLARLLPEVDCFIKGDAEFAFLRAAKVLLKAKREKRLTSRQKSRIIKLHGIYFKHENFIHKDERTNKISRKALNRIEIDWGIEQLKKDISNDRGLRLNTRRGCRYSCVFCSHKYTKTSVSWSAGKIISELKRIKSLIESGVLPKEARYISFDDDDFFQGRVRTKRFLRMLAQDTELNSYFTFQFQGSASSFMKKGGGVDEEIFRLLSGLNKVRVSLGTDAFCDEEIKVLGKYRYRMEDVRLLIDAFERYGIFNCHYLILTTNETTPVTLRKTLEELRGILMRYGRFRVSSINPNIKIYPGSSLGKLAVKGKLKGRIKYVHRFDGEFFGYLDTEDKLVREFLDIAVNREFRYWDDVERLDEMRKRTDKDSLEYHVYTLLIRFIQNSIKNNRYKISDFWQSSMWLENLFVVDKMIAILNDLEGFPIS